MKRSKLSHQKNQRTRFGGRLSPQRMTFLPLIVLLLFLGGCGGGTPTVPLPTKGKATPVAKKTTEGKKAAEQQEVAKQEAEYSYNPMGKPDPFKPFIQLTPVRAGARGGPLTPLQRYEISQLKLVAIISAPDGNMALVEDSAGKGFFLKKGTLVGKNDGKVTKILKDRVIFEELYLDVYGQTKNQEVTLNLRQPEEGTEP